jgi:hypothetical protein
MNLYAHTPSAYPLPHAHENALIATVLFVVESVHLAPFRHGFEAHSFASTAQLLPCHPLAHLHAYASISTVDTLLDSVHVALFLHGVEVHSLLSLHEIPFPLQPWLQEQL